MKHDDVDSSNGHGPRAKYLTGKPAANDVDAPSYSLTIGQMKSLMKSVVDERPAAPLLVDKQTLACLLSVSTAHIDKLRKLGLPTVMVGESVRFKPEVVVEWLTQRTPEAARG